MLKFNQIDFESAVRYSGLYAQCEEKASDYTFSNIWNWNEKYHFEWAFADDLCWLRHKIDGKVVYYAPIGHWKRTDWKKLLNKYFPHGFDFVRVPDYLATVLAEQFEEKLSIKEQRSHFEYIYSIQELISLNGYRFRNKRKQSNQFKQYYNYIYKQISSELIEDVKKFQKQWLEQKEVKKDVDYKMIELENVAIISMLDNWSRFADNIFGGVLIINNQIMAYTLGEKLDEDTIAIHFEKASYEYRGSYAALNRITLENIGNNYRFVNREQDLGLEGLRKVKLEYSPVRFVKKYRLSNI